MKRINEINGQNLKSALINVGDYAGVAGIYKYFPNREWRLDLVVRTYHNGKQVPYDIVKRQR
jgi:hypothetical protein